LSVSSAVDLATNNEPRTTDHGQHLKHPATAHVKNLTGNEGGFLGSKKLDSFRDVAAGGRTAHREPGVYQLLCFLQG
jgi:hypothetical protein